MRWLVAALIAFAMSPMAQAQVVEFDFAGNAGSGLLPGNEVGANTSLGSASTAFGGEVDGGILFDVGTNVLDINFSFEDLDGGLLLLPPVVFTCTCPVWQVTRSIRQAQLFST